MKKIQGHLLYSGIVVASILGIVFSAQVLYYRQQVLGYQNMKNYNIARTMRNLALANGISNNEVMWFNHGSVTKKSDHFTVKMDNKEIIELTTLMKYDFEYQRQKVADLK